MVPREAHTEHNSLVDNAGYNSTLSKAAAGACRAESARPMPGQRAISSAGTPSTASAISR
jgi:hypothetical protein